MKKYQINIIENKDGSVEVERVCVQGSKKPNRKDLKVIDKRDFTRFFLNKVETFVTK
tara:strand:+ start:235 stop:405 length:171 start_codon:yes stop_codon:yes gene_type:complete